MRLRADARAPAEARAFIRGATDTMPITAETREDVVLMASELVTNAVQSGASDISIGLVVNDQELLLIVNDDGAGWPTVSAAEDDEEGGRGLAIVAQLADRWEVVRQAHGKRVRAILGMNNDMDNAVPG